MAMIDLASTLARQLLASCILVAPSRTVAASEPEEASPATEPQPTEPNVVVHAEMEGGGEIAAVLHGEIVAALRDAQVDPDRPELAPLEIVISPDPDTIGEYEVVLRHRGQTRRSWSCLCSGEELRARLARDAVEVWKGILAEPTQAPPGALAPAPVPSAPEVADTAPTSRRREPGRGLFIAGVATTAIGTAAVVGSAALLLSDASADHGRSPTTLGVLGGGVTVVAVGVTLWGVGAHRRNHPRLAVLPTARSHGVLLTIGGVF